MLQGIIRFEHILLLQACMQHNKLLLMLTALQSTHMCDAPVTVRQLQPVNVN